MFSFLSHNILTRAFWGDEAWTALISALPIKDLIATTAADFHPPFYYLVLHFWIMVAGSSEVSLRLISLLFWILAAVASYYLARSLAMKKMWALLTSLFILFNPFIFVYAFEARNYTLFIFLSIASFWQFNSILKGKGKNLLYLLPSVLGLYTHYYMFFLVGSQFLFIILTRKDLWKRFLVLAGAFFLCYLPWLPFFFAQTKSVVGGYWIAPVTYETIRDTAKVLIRGEQYTRYSDYLPLYFTYFLALASIRAFIKKRLFTKTTLLLLLWFFIPFFTPVLLSQIRPIFFYRYLVIAAVPVMLLALWGVADLELKENSKKIVSPDNFQKFFIAIPLLFLGVFLYTDYLAFTTRTDELFRPILRAVHSSPTKVPIYTTLPSFAEVVYYNNYSSTPLPVKIIPEGLSQASGKALLDTYIKKGYVTLETPPVDKTYWRLDPGPSSQLIEVPNQTPSQE